MGKTKSQHKATPPSVVGRVVFAVLTMSVLFGILMRMRLFPGPTEIAYELQKKLGWQDTDPQLASIQSFHDLSALDLGGNAVSMSEYDGLVVLVVNVASACGYTESNYAGLIELHQKYASQGLRILAFP